MNLKKIKLTYKKSKLFDITRNFSLSISKIVYSSFFYKILFIRSHGENFFAKSYICKILSFLIKIILLIKNFLLPEKLYDDSLFKKMLSTIFDIKLNPVVLKSFSWRFISDFFDLKIEQTNDKQKNFNFIRLGFLLLVLGFFFMSARLIGIRKAFFIISGIIFSLLVLYKTQIGIYALAFFAPLLPTKFILALILLTAFSFIFNLIFGNTNLGFKVDLIDMFIILFFILISYTTYISYMPVLSLKPTLVYLLFIMFYFILKSVIKTKHELFLIASLLILSSSFVALVGISQKYLGLNLNINSWIDEEMFSDNKIRVFSTLGNPNVLGEYLLLTMPICLGSVCYFKNKLCKLLASLIFILLSFCMLLTLSRGAWLGLIFALSVFIFMRDKKFLWLIIFLAFLSPIFIPKSFVQRFMSIGNMADTSTSYRVGIWIGALKIIKDFWPIGIGLGTDNFVYVYQKYALASSYALHSHNFYLQILIDFGISGLFLIFSIIFLFYKSLLVDNKFLHDDFIKTFKISLCAGVLGYLVQSLTDNTWYNYRIIFLFWFIMALANIAGSLSELNIWGKFKFFQHRQKTLS